MNLKKCTRCKNTKETNNFSKCIKSKDGFYSHCRACKSEIARNYRKNNPEKSKEYDRRRGAKYREKSKERRKVYYQENKDKFRDRRFLKKFGITLDEYNKIFEEQNGCCVICEKHQIEFERALAVDHNHKTGEVRGLLCTYCNMGIGQLNENIEVLERAIKYLKKYNDK